MCLLRRRAPGPYYMFKAYGTCHCANSAILPLLARSPAHRGTCWHSHSSARFRVVCPAATATSGYSAVHRIMMGLLPLVGR